MKILTEKGACVISLCADCGMMNIWHHNLMLCFTPEQFRLFQQFASEMEFNKRSYTLPDGSERLVLCTPNNDINFVFTSAEWDDFNTALTEACYLQEVYYTIYQKR